MEEQRSAVAFAVVFFMNAQNSLETATKAIGQYKILLVLFTYF
jgi:hypothetical protein